MVGSQMMALAWAQEPPAQSSAAAPANPVKNEASAQAEEKGQIATIVVTASKRKEDVRKIPLSITVIGGEALEDQHITDFTDLTRSVPNLSFSGGAGGGGSGLSNIELRGISSQAGSSTVGVYLDDISMTTRNLYSLGSAEPKFFDIDHVEVLRGPQGTLYGASSMGGTIKFVSNQPNVNSTETNISSEVSSTEHGGINDSISLVHNVPLVPGTLGLRFGVQTGKTSGYIDQVSQANPSQIIARGINSEKDLVLRAALKWTPNAQLSVTPSIFYQKVTSDGLDVSHLTDFNGNPLPANQTDQLLREPGVDKLIVPSLTITYDTGTADLTSVTSYFKRDFNRTQDGQSANSEYFGCCLIGAGAGLGGPVGLADAVNALPSAVYLNNSIKQVSQELRLASKAYDANGAPFVWLAGIYYSDLKTKVTDNEPVFGINATFNNFGANIADPSVLSGAFVGDFPNDNAYFSERRYAETQAAIFGEFSYYLTPALRFTIGARKLHAKETLDRDGNYYFAGGPVSSSYTKNFDSFTPKYALSWDVNSYNTVFASSTKGFRLGGANRAIPWSICGDELSGTYHLSAPPGTFESDTLWSYEAGNKSRFFDNRLSVNASFFYVRWRNIQQDIQLSCTFDFEGNFGAATSKGAEIEVTARPTSNLTLGLFGGYTRATFDEAVSAINVSAGAEIQGVPKMNAALTADYRFFSGDSYTTFVRGAVRWVGSSHGSFDPGNSDYVRPSYKTVDASIGASFSNNWEVSLFAKNLLNDQTVLQQPYVQFLTEAYRQRPRTIGVNVSVKM
jgi:outer membrane receptor protein involved in Fe transport